jgi:hypothetical protein
MRNFWRVAVAAWMIGCSAGGGGGGGATGDAAPSDLPDASRLADGGGVPRGDAGPGDDALVPACENGAKRCGDAGVEVCAGGVFAPLASCPAGTICAEGECVTPMAVCDDGVCSGTENCATCAGDCACPEGATCATERGVCVQGCAPTCGARTCGDDGCGGTCGACAGDTICDATGQCVARSADCGDQTCDAASGEDCATCPADCGACCGDGQCGGGQGENCSTCPADCVCGAGQVCDGGSRTCMDNCEPACDGRACGDDGCGGQCGACAQNQACDALGQCGALPARCGDQTCDAAGDEDCGNCPADCGTCCGDGACVAGQGENCATCIADCRCNQGEACNADTRACVPVCAPECAGKDCGDDGCGGTCGRCANAEVCSADGQCLCVPACDGRACGADGCGGTCGACANGQVCSADGACVGAPNGCGDAACVAGQGEDCATCPADCGRCCGDGACDAGQGEGCATCPADCGCGAGTSCDAMRGVCVCTPACNGRACGDDGCGGVCGQCGPDAVCNGVSGACEAVCVPQCLGRLCGDDGCGGSCGACMPGVTHCDAATGQCAPDCAPVCDGRSCGDDGCGGVCGVCAAGTRCDAAGRCLPDACDCVGGQLCVDGVCRDPAVLCAPENPIGLCAEGQVCAQGSCVDVGAGCSGQNPTGICPVGQICRVGACVDLDDAALCDDANPCTEDTFDFVRNRCGHAPTNGRCTDGNGCTSDACVRGICVSARVAGCIEPPHIDPYVTPTNVALLTLTGTKPAGSAIEIDGQAAVPESPATDFNLMLNLRPGENVYQIRSVDRGVRSESVEVSVVYDITPPVTRVNPPGGLYLNGVTATAATDEPARVYFTTDGGTPDEFSDSFQSVRSFRIFDNTTLRLRARDPAGNWEAQVVEARFEITGDGNGWTPGTTLPEPLTLMGVTALAESIYVVGGSDGHSVQAGTMAYNTATDAWLDLPALAVARAQNAVVNVGGFVYTIGGENDGLPLNLVERFQPGGAAWQARAIMPTTRFGLAAAVHGTRIFAFGGKTNGDRVLDVAEAFDTAANAWANNIAALPRARYGARALTVGDRIFLIGGEDAQGRPLPQVDVYEPLVNRWTQVAALPTPRSWPAVMLQANLGTVADGYTGIVVAGGRVVGGQPTTVVEEYILGDDVWRTRTPLPEGRHSTAGVTVTGVGLPDTEESRAWIVGGLTATNLTPDLSYFVVEQDFSRLLADLPDGRFAHGAAAIGNRIWLAGGRNFQEEAGVWSFDPETQRYEDAPPLPSVQNDLGVVGLDGLLYAIGGANQFGLSVPTLRAFDPIAGTWTNLAPMNTARKFPAVVAVGGQIWAIGGFNGAALQSVEIYSPEDDTWRNGPVLPVARSGAVAATRDGQVLLFGGYDAANALVAPILRLRNNAWEAAGGNFAGAYATALSVHDDQVLLIGGRDALGAPLARALSYDVAQAAFVPANNRLFLPRDFQAAAALNGDLYLFGGNETPMIGPAGTTQVQKIRSSCFNGVLDAGESALPGDPDRISGAGCGSAGGLWSSRGGNIAMPADPRGYALQHADLSATGISDGGGDAFDGYGNPITVTFNNVAVAIDPSAGSRNYNVGGFPVRLTSDFPSQNIWRLRIEPQNAADNRAVTFSLSGNMGSDGSTVCERLNANFRGRAVPYLYSHDPGLGDPPVVHMIVPSLPAQIPNTAIACASDSIGVAANAVNLPLTFYVVVGYTAHLTSANAVLTDIAE